jgi:nucleoside-diphosphate-sugar epimerase
MDKILLTGANGFLGNHIQKVFQQYDLITIGREACTLNIDLSKDIPTFVNDFNIVIHCAGIAHYVPKDKIEQDRFYDDNLNITKNLITAFNKNITLPETFIFISSVAVYGIESGFDIDENSPLLGSSPYALSKIKSEEILMDWGQKNGVKILILRLPLIVGENPPGNLGAMIRAIRKGYYFKFNDGSARKSMVSAEDISHFITLNLQSEGVFNLTDGFHPTLKEIEEKIAKILNKKLYRIPKFIIFLISKLGDILPFVPINSDKLNKLNNSLTFSDIKARKFLNWNSKSALKDLSISNTKL